jgi:hypothetical protein
MTTVHDRYADVDGQRKIEVSLDRSRLRLEPGQSVVPHGVDRDLITGEVAPGRKP